MADAGRPRPRWPARAGEARDGRRARARRARRPSGSSTCCVTRRRVVGSARSRRARSCSRSRAIVRFRCSGCRPSAMATDRAAWEWLRTQAPGPMLELPIGGTPTRVRYLGATLIHRHPIVNGYSGYGSLLQDFVGIPFADLDRLDEALTMARGLGIRWLAVHPPDFGRDRADGRGRWPARCPPRRVTSPASRTSAASRSPNSVRWRRRASSRVRRGANCRPRRSSRRPLATAPCCRWHSTATLRRGGRPVARSRATSGSSSPSTVRSTSRACGWI